MYRGLWMVAVCLVAAPLMAQPPAQGQRGGRMGFFGSGGGMSSSVSGMYGRLLRSEKVQKELELVDDQKAKIKELEEKRSARMREAMPSRENMRDMSEQQREARFAEMRKKMEEMNAEQKKAIEEILLPNQVERLREIAIQVSGTRAIEDPEIQQALGMTSAQKESLTKLREEAGQKMRELFSQRGDQSSREASREKFQAMMKTSQEKMMSVLTPEQQQKLEKMKGAKVDIDPSELSRGGDRGRRGQQGGARPQQ